MGKKKSSGSQSKSAAKSAKKAKAVQKVEKREKKKQEKSKNDADDDDNLEDILDNLRREWEESHKVTEELVEGPPSRRANATLTTCPSGSYLWCIGGEYYSDDGKAHFYQDVFRYSPEKDEWRKFVSPTCPGPRSAHAVVTTPAGGGKLFLFGGEFSSLHQTTFHHYRDFWCFDVTTHDWDRIETKIRPGARSGHRMTMWKHYILLFGGFHDSGLITKYLGDLWAFDTQEYKWQQIEFKEGERKPSPRSGFSFLPSADGILLYGGYCKEYVKGKRPIGIMLNDTWFLRLSLITPNENSSKKYAEVLSAKWEVRKKRATAFAPSTRSGCSMTLWGAKNMGILFGGVTDDDTSEETMESVFWNDLYGYQLTDTGRWVSMNLKRPKKKGGARKEKKSSEPLSKTVKNKEDTDVDEGGDQEENEVRELSDKTWKQNMAATTDPDDPELTRPLPRYNTMLAVLRNTLYIYGGIYERGSREYILDDFYSIQLDKIDQFVCLKESGVVIQEGEESSEDDEDGDDDDSDDDDEDDDQSDDSETTLADAIGTKTNLKEQDDADPEEADMIVKVELHEQIAKDELRSKATAFMGVAKDTARSAEDVLSTPLPGETLAMFYARSREFWSQRAHGASENRGKALRRDAFALAEEKYADYKPILDEVEQILAEAGLDADEIKRGAAAPAAGEFVQNRNRR